MRTVHNYNMQHQITQERLWKICFGLLVEFPVLLSKILLSTMLKYVFCEISSLPNIQHIFQNVLLYCKVQLLICIKKIAENLAVFIVDSLTSVSVVQERDMELAKEAQRQEENDKLRKEFAKHANAFHQLLTDTRWEQSFLLLCAG